MSKEEIQVGDLVKHRRKYLNAGLVVSDSSLCFDVPKDQLRVYWFKYSQVGCHYCEYLSKLTSS